VKFLSYSILAAFVAAGLFVTSAGAQKQYSIAEIQGAGNTSPHVGESVTVSGVVTARTKTGIFVQTPDDLADKDPATSEGVFVFTQKVPPTELSVSASITISGRVDEYRNRSDVTSLTTTEISHRLGQDTYKVISPNVPLPKPIALTAADFAANKVDELEKFEGMRISFAEMLVVAPTGGRVDIKNASATSDGTFFAVVKGMNRPFREPGLDIRNFSALADRDKVKLDHPGLRLFDSNPEIIRVDTNEQLLSGADAQDQQAAPTLNVAAQTVLSNITGVLHYGYGRYTLLPDSDKKITATSGIKTVALPVPTDRQFSVAGMNLENFFDDVDDPDIKEDVLTPEAFQRRLKKVSMVVRNYLEMPDVIGMAEVENLSTLKRLADRINADAVSAGKSDPKYEAYLIEGNDGRGIDVGYLVKSSRLKVLEVKQFGKTYKFKNPDTSEDEFLNDRPPLMMRLAIDDAKTGKPFEFTLIVNHLKSMLGYDDPKQMANVRMKKRLQAEFLARFVQDRLKADPNERIALIGDFNAFQFNDGVMDVVGTIKGKPAGKDEVLMPSDDLLNPDLTDLVDVINPKEKYSYTYDGNAQAIDHMIVSPAFVNCVKGFGYLRVNADFPESLRNDDSRPERYSDHDPAIALFSLDAPASKP
jgi:predicted extracellular nuclease